MNIRREPTYLSSDVWKACWLIARTRASEDGRPISTADEMADSILREALEQKYPQIFKHLRDVAKQEKELLKTLT
jgi:3'-phosphoadenosine 5'-phosphosulfate (PAPS) 3'-phosphatase